jgi:hypothetical protein
LFANGWFIHCLFIVLQTLRNITAQLDLLLSISARMGVNFHGPMMHHGRVTATWRLTRRRGIFRRSTLPKS